MIVQPFKTLVLDLLEQDHLDEEAFLQNLSETERTAIGTPRLWSAKDHLAHRTFWHQDLVRKLTAIQHHQEVPPSEEDLTATGRFPSISGERPLYAAFLGGCYEHDQEHLAQYYLDRHDRKRAIQIREKCANRIILAPLLEWVKGSFLYNLACFYAQLQELSKAAAFLQEALTFDPGLKEQSQRDPELVALRDQSV